jgi:AraC-like DNA-binding protein/mannose-6-phosphate isomerase-like protein (cupin superfamily)
MTPDADALSALLEAIQVRSVVYCRSELGAPWGFRVTQSPQPKFHIVLSGAATLTVDTGEGKEGGEALAVAAGDLVLLPRGSGHVMRDRSTSRLRHLDRILQDHPVDAAGMMHYGGHGPKTLVVCGGFETASSNDVLAWLPPVLVFDTADNGLGRWLDPMIDLVRNESRTKPGDAAVVAKVADVFLTDVLRHYLTSSKGSLTITPLSASTDPTIADAVALMHNRASEPWTIAALAHQVGMSRSSFAARFRAAVGVAPIAYLTRLRLARAAGSLATSTRPLAEEARSAGYDNESSFSKAFARRYGQPPGKYRAARRTFG